MVYRDIGVVNKLTKYIGRNLINGFKNYLNLYSCYIINLSSKLSIRN